MQETEETGWDVRDRVLAAAIALLARSGREAMTTRAVAAAARVQAPTIYRLFGDKLGLVDAVAERGFETYLQRKKTHAPSTDPIESLRRGWDLHVGFGLDNPALFVAMYGDPRPGRASPAATRALAMLRERMRSLARAGRLRVDEKKATNMVSAAACGVVFVLLETPESERDGHLSEAMCEAVISTIIVDAPDPAQLGLAPVATTLRALLPDAAGLSDGEQHLLGEWLERLARGAHRAE